LLEAAMSPGTYRTDTLDQRFELKNDHHRIPVGHMKPSLDQIGFSATRRAKFFPLGRLILSIH
jgi:hypothetical protein